MNNKRYYWLKLKEDFFQDKKIKKLRQLAGGDTYTIIYLKLQLLSLKNNGNLYFENIEDTFIEELALDIDEAVEDVKVCVMYLIKCGLIDEISETEFGLVETKQCIGSETASTIRSRKCRQKQNMLLCNTDATKCNGEIDIDIELDKDIEKEKENIKEKEINSVEYYEQEIGQLSSHQIEVLFQFEDELGLDLVKEAINKTVDSNVKKFSYLKAILSDWKIKGYKTLEEVNDITKSYKMKEINMPDWLNMDLYSEEMNDDELKELESDFNDIFGE